ALFTGIPGKNFSEVLTSLDNPGLRVPAFFDNAVTSRLTSANVTASLVTFLAAQTSDTANGANDRYFARAHVDWQVDFSGTITAAAGIGNYVPSATNALTISGATATAGKLNGTFTIDSGQDLVPFVVDPTTN